jgi:hypothetical protein
LVKYDLAQPTLVVYLIWHRILPYMHVHRMK